MSLIPNLCPILPALAKDWWVDGSNLQEHPGRHLAHRGSLTPEVEQLPEVLMIEFEIVLSSNISGKRWSKHR